MKNTLLLAATLLLTSSGIAGATTISFETGAPALFNQTTPLTGEFKKTGAFFSGNGGGIAGSILDQASAFGINARTGNDFLAFNTLNTGNGDTVSFATPVDTVSLFIGDGLSGNFTLTAFDGKSVIGTDVKTSQAGDYTKLSFSGANITSISFMSSNLSAYVVDDLSFAAAPVPEPSTFALLGSGLAGLAALRRRFRA